MRTLIIENDVAFDIVGQCWIFTKSNAEKVKALWAAHLRKLEKRGLRPPRSRMSRHQATA